MELSLFEKHFGKTHFVRVSRYEVKNLKL